jgi:hypothetical protein
MFQFRWLFSPFQNKKKILFSIENIQESLVVAPAILEEALAPRDRKKKFKR